MRLRTRFPRAAIIAMGAIVAVAAAGRAGSQEAIGAPDDPNAAIPRMQLSLGAQAIGLVTRASPAYANRTLTEGYLTQPMVTGSLSAAGGAIGVRGMLDLEGLTLERGELNAGIFGEGYVDRRHPHTYLHELVGSITGAAGDTRFSVATGKGFIPFGTDDPMVRPLVKYPVNHHISQIVERLLVAAAVRHGPALLEAARFNGDEPESPSDMPNRNRFWDSWAARASVLPTRELEIQASTARVKSPELARGGGLDQRKTNFSLRFESVPAAESPIGMPMGNTGAHGAHTAMQTGRLFQWQQYFLVEIGRSSDYDGEAKAFSFSTFLGEAEVRHMGVFFAARLERTERPDEVRLADPFRTPRPANDFSILGRTRWDIVSARLGSIAYESSAGSLTPFIEISRQHATPLLRPAGFDPRGFYGSDRLWSFSGGITYAVGMKHRRTGRYGAAAEHH